MSTEPKTAPPNDGGEQRAFRRAEEALVDPDPPGAERPIARDPAPGRGRRSLTPWLVFIALLFLAVVIVYLVAPLSSSGDANERPAATQGRD